MPAPLVTLTTDFGLVDPSVGAIRGVLHSLAPGVAIADISHNVPPFDIERGARMLEYALPYYPAGSIHVAVVDPGVGTARRGIAVRTKRGDILIGPDNGLLIWAADRLGGIEEAVELRQERFRLHPVSHTFHGRDVFCPAAAFLIRGEKLLDFGPLVEPPSLRRLPRLAATVEAGHVSAPVATIAQFGNCHFDVLRDQWQAAGFSGRPDIAVTVDGRRWTLPFVKTFGQVEAGLPLLLEDSFGRLCLAVNQGNARSVFGLEVGTRVDFRLP